MKELLSLFNLEGPYFMVVIHPDGRISVDGGHDNSQGVVRAKELYQSISVIRPKEGSRYFQVRVDPVPERKVKVNRRAIKTLNDAAATLAAAKESK